jgi:hypothetical protein
MTSLGFFLAVAWEEHGREIVTGAAVLVAMGVIWRYLILPPIRLFKRLEKAVMMVEREMRPNGGSSLRDSNDRLERVVGEVSVEVAKIGGRMDEANTRLTAVEDYITRGKP